MTALTIEPARVRARIAAMVSVAVAVVILSLVVAWPWSQNQDMNLVGSVIVLVAAFLLVGSMIALKQPQNALGWVLNLVAIFFAILTVSGGPQLKVATSETRLWLSVVLSGWWAPPIFTLLSVVPLIFPNGSLPSRRWRLVIWAAAIGSVLTIVSSPFDPEAVEPPLVNPIANKGLYDGLGFGAPLGLAAIVFAMVGMVLRFRRARGAERDQMKLFVTAVVIAVTSMVLNGLLIGIIGEQEVSPWIEGGLLVFSAAILSIGIGVAILRHKMFDLNVVISKAVVYGVIALFVTGLYLLVVVVLGSFTWYIGGSGAPNRWLTGIVIGGGVLLFDRLRRRATHFANRLVYGKRATPYEVLSKLSDQLRETSASEDVLAQMAQSMAQGSGASKARVWMRTGDVLWTAASWPADLPKVETPIDGNTVPPLEDASLIVPVEHWGDVLGALSITKPPSDPLTTTEERLITDLGAQAGLVLRNARLTQELLARLEELKASRVRLVKAQDEERRRLERNLHDGAQQMLVALKVKAGLAVRVTQDEQLKTVLEQIVIDAGDALEQLRDLARGIYPPLLASDGLDAALRAQARKATIPVEVESDGIGRYPQEAEAAVYFCVLEALQNVQKYAGAASVVVTLSDREGRLSFRVVDDGAGFDPVTTGAGSGTQNMRDRLAALAGEVLIESAPAQGTTVTGWLPARQQPRTM